jgi:hypothetical protein
MFDTIATRLRGLAMLIIPTRLDFLGRLTS